MSAANCAVSKLGEYPLLKSQLTMIATALALAPLLGGCGSKNPDTMIGKNINMNAIVDANAVDENVANGIGQQPATPASKSDNSTELSVKRSASDRASTNSVAVQPRPQPDEPPPDLTAEQPSATKRGVSGNDLALAR